MRKTIIAGNWKMNKTNTEAIELVKKLQEKVKGVKNVEIVVGPTSLALADVKRELKDSNIKVAAQNMRWEESGSVTGEISPVMLNDLKIDYVILGHSERRAYFGEDNEEVNKKVKSAVEHNLKPIICVGEKLEDREAGETKKVVEDHVKGALEGLTEEDMNGVVIAYEPIWAIGTGKTATPEQANDVHAFIRELLTDMYNEEVANNTTIQYGGSMKPHNAEGLLAQEHIDGGLVGGASLEAKSFSEIIECAK
ncbi:MAG: triose-phosphate isomerase [Fusobacteriota bacterium]